MMSIDNESGGCDLIDLINPFLVWLGKAYVQKNEENDTNQLPQMRGPQKFTGMDGYLSKKKKKKNPQTSSPI